MGITLHKRKTIYATSSKSSTIISALTILSVILIIITTIFSVRTKILQNVQSLGTSLTKSFAYEQEAQVDMFSNFLSIGSEYANDIIRNDGTAEDVQKWMLDYYKKITNLFGEKVIDPYAVIDGEIVAAYPWDGDSTYDYEQTEWYRQALKHKGEIHFTDAYQDVITKNTVITASIALEKENAVLAMDIYMSKLQNTGNFFEEDLGDSSIYLCDSKGNLIISKNPWNKEVSEISPYIKQLFSSIKKGHFAPYDAFYKDFNNVKRGVYYHELTNGWMVIMTIPVQSILLGDGNALIYSLIGVGLILTIILCFIFIRDVFHYKKMRIANDTIAILSDSFYAIYRVNLKNGTYITLKNSYDIDKIVGTSGSYEHLLDTIKSVVEKGTYQEFALCFSLDSIKQRVKERIADYGGDYKRRFDDEYKWVNIRTLYNEEIAPNEVILCFRDVDVEKRQELQHTLLLQEALDANKKNTEAKEVFFSNMSHEMRTPLNAIIGFSKLALEMKDMPEKLRDYLKKISFSGQNMLSLINDILELSRLESGHLHLEYKDFDIESCIHNISGTFEAKSIEDNKNFEVKVDIKNKCIKGDELKIVQILNNLLSNAFKYSESGDNILLDVKELEYRQYHKIQFIIKDTGIGMSESFLNHLFEPYARETHFTTKATIGTGLGMPIVKSLVEQMSGEINVKSKLKEGTTVTITLPFEVGGTKVEENKEDQNQSDDILKGKKVLLAEDNELNREIATELLEMHDMEVIAAENGREAVDIFQSSSPYTFDLILMDMQMPIMDGCEASKNIRALDRDDAESIPIIAVTANAFSEDVSKVLRSGMNAHIAKPIDFKVLQDVLKEYIK